MRRGDGQMGNGVLRFFIEVFSALGWILFRYGAKSRELERNLRAVRWTIATTHVIVLIGLAVYALPHPILAAVGLILLCLSLAGLVLKYRSLACSLREELVRSVMES